MKMLSVIFLKLNDIMTLLCVVHCELCQSQSFKYIYSTELGVVIVNFNSHNIMTSSEENPRSSGDIISRGMLGAFKLFYIKRYNFTFFIVTKLRQ